MQRENMLNALKNETDYWDFIVVGGGATGLGVAVDAATRGFKTLLLEKHDFAKGTSGRSTKLVHGGVRYLKQGNISLVMEALRERGLMEQNAPHLVFKQKFVIPAYNWWSKPFYGVGMKVYDMLAGKLGFGNSKTLSKNEILEYLPTINTEGLKGGVLYYDGQFDDSRLAVNLAQTATENGGVVLNYMNVTGVTKTNGKIDGVTAEDSLSGQSYQLKARAVINATGVFADALLGMDNKDSKPIIAPSQGIHIVLDKKFLPGDSAIMVPNTADGRVLFAVPWQDKIVLGTTDTSVDQTDDEPRATEEEIEFVLSHAAKYLTGNPTRDDVRSVFTGLRPLVKVGDSKNTSAISRDHTLLISESGLVTITGGKWTTYRKMAEDVVDKASEVAQLENQECITNNLRIHGWVEKIDRSEPMYYYGADRAAIFQLAEEQPELNELIHERLPYLKAEVVWAARNEMAMTVEDVLSRRLRALLLDAEASVEAAPEVARLMAEEKGYDEPWQQQQVNTFNKLAETYILKSLESG